MATTIRQGFQTLKSNLEITDLQAETVSTRQTNVRDAVEDEMTVLDSFVTGSYARNTMIAPLAEADVDIFVVLDPTYFKQDGQAALLDKVRQVLLKTYPKTPQISRNGQAVTISFSDFQVDVVPAFYRKDGGFLIPDSQQARWIATDPKKHVQVWADANKTHDGNLVPLIKMAKGWNKSHSKTLRSFHLEAMVLQVLQGVSITDFSTGARIIFDKLRWQMQVATNDPAGYSGNLGDYLDTYQKKKDALDHMEAAFAKAREAELLELRGKTEEAFGKWRIVFGDYFPAYG